MKNVGSCLGTHLRTLWIAAMVVSLSHSRTGAASYEWTFSNGNLGATLGNGTLTYAGQGQALTTFGATGGSVPNIGGQVASFMHVPGFANQADGYQLTLADSGPNGGGSYINNYTIIFDLLTPNPPAGAWTALFNTNPDNASGNDADFYIAADYSVGIGNYSAANALSPNAWHRLAFVDQGTSLSFYVDGAPVGSRTSGVSLDGRWSLYSNQDAGADLFLFNEGDTSGVYTHELYVSSIAFVDRVLTDQELSDLGGAKALGILVPEPTSLSLMILAFLMAGAVRPRA